MGLKERLIKVSTIKDTASLSDSRLFEKKDIISIDECPRLNIALSGDALHGGLMPGIIQIAAESKHFKSKFALLIAKAFLDKHPDGIIIFYDSEFGTPEAYFEGMDTSKILHKPVMDLEQFKVDIMQTLKEITKEDKVLILVDSIGNMASIKEIEDAEDGKSVADMTRAKQMKSVFRMIMPRINSKNIYTVIVNHTYKTIEMYSKDVPTGGTGSIYNSNVIWTISKEKEKEEKEVIGYNFTIKIYKSRFVKEEAKVTISVTYDGGIEKWTGMLDTAIEAGYVTKVTAQSYARKDKISETYKRKDIENNDAFWTALFNETDFNEWIKKEYQI